MEVTSNHLSAALHGWRDGAGPLYVRLAEALRRLGESGVLGLETRLPSERALADGLAVSRNTVTAAYQQLRDAGWLSGTSRAAPRIGAGAGPLGELAAPDTRVSDLFGALGHEPEGLINLAVVMPDAAPAVRDAFAVLASGPDAALLSSGGYAPFGHPQLIEAIVERLRADGVPAEPDEVVITNGAQQAITLVAAALASTRPAAAEEITYPGAVTAIAASTDRDIVPLPVDCDGVRTEKAVKIIRATRPAFVYLTIFQNPTGAAGEANCRDRQLAAAARARSAVVEDRTLAELSLGTMARRPFASATARPPTATIATIGSMSKLFWGGLRVGWVHTNRTLAGHLRTRRAAHDLGSPAFLQLVAARLLNADFERTVAWRRDRLAASLAAFTDELAAQRLPLRFHTPAGGPVLWAELPHGDANRFARLAVSRGVAVLPGGACAVTAHTASSHIRLSLLQPPDVLRTAAGRLADTWRIIERER